MHRSTGFGDPISTRRCQGDPRLLCGFNERVKTSLRWVWVTLVLSTAAILPATKWVVFYALGYLWGSKSLALFLIPVVVAFVIGLFAISAVLLWRSLNDSHAMVRGAFAVIVVLVLVTGFWAFSQKSLSGLNAHALGLAAAAKARLNCQELQTWVRGLERELGVREKGIDLPERDLPAQILRLGGPTRMVQYFKTAPSALPHVRIVWGWGLEAWDLDIAPNHYEPEGGSSRFIEVCPGVYVVTD